MFLLAIYTKCKYWQWSLDFEISCSSFWNLEAITSTNWIRKQRTPSTWSPVYDVALNLRKWTQNIRDSKCMEEPWLKLLWQDFIIRLRETLEIFVTITMTVLNANVFPDDLTFIRRAHQTFKCPSYERTRPRALQPFKSTVHSCIGLEL